MLNFNEIKTGKVIKVNDAPFVIIKTDHHKMGRGGAVLKIKLRNLLDRPVTAAENDFIRAEYPNGIFEEQLQEVKQKLLGQHVAMPKKLMAV